MHKMEIIHEICSNPMSVSHLMHHCTCNATANVMCNKQNTIARQLEHQQGSSASREYLTHIQVNLASGLTLSALYRLRSLCIKCQHMKRYVCVCVLVISIFYELVLLVSWLCYTESVASSWKVCLVWMFARWEIARLLYGKPYIIACRVL